MRACVDAGPVIHLEEIQRREPWGLFDELLLPEPVAEEVLRDPEGPGAALVEKPSFDRVPVDGRLSDVAGMLAMRHEVSFADGTVLAVALRDEIGLVLTDDLDLRDAAQVEGLQPVGSIGLLLRAAKEGLLDESLAREALTALGEDSSLFLTPGLVEKAQRALADR